MEDHPGRAPGEETLLVVVAAPRLQVFGEVEDRWEVHPAPPADSREMAPLQVLRQLAHGFTMLREWGLDIPGLRFYIDNPSN